LRGIAQVPESWVLFPRNTTGTGGAAETDPIASVAVKTLSDAVALLPTNATLTPIKDDITALQTTVTGLASKTDLAAANLSLTAVADAVKKLEADGSPAALKALQDAVAKAEADITALKTKQDDHAAALQKTTTSLADLAIVVAKMALDGVTGAAIAGIQTRLDNLDKSKADKISLDALTKSVGDLTTALTTSATDDELKAAIAEVDKTITALEAATKAASDILAAKIKVNADAIAVNKTDIAELQKKTGNVIRYSKADTVLQDVDHLAIFGDGLKAMAMPKLSLGRRIEVIRTGVDEILLSADGAEVFKKKGVSDHQLNLNVDDILGVIVGNVDSWDFFGNGAAPTVSGGDRIEIVVLPLLRANTWTTFPAPTDGSVVNDYSILDSAKRDITHTIDIEPDGDSWKVRSLVEKTNLQFRYELGAKP
jgi:hypothetical protein